MANGLTTIVLVGAGCFGLGRIGLSGGVAAAVQAQTAPGGGSPAAPPPLRDAAAVAAPGPHHRELDALVGTWSAEVTVRAGVEGPASVLRGTVTRAWALGGRFLREVTALEGGGAPFEQLAFIGFDNFDGQYQVVRMDTASTAIRYGTGTLHPEERVMHVTGGRREPASGRLLNGWTKLDSSDPARHVLIEYQTDEQGRTFRAQEWVLEPTNPATR